MCGGDGWRMHSCNHRGQRYRFSAAALAAAAGAAAAGAAAAGAGAAAGPVLGKLPGVPQPILKPRFRDDTLHMFRVDKGHVPDTPGNRQILQDAIRPENVFKTQVTREGGTLVEYRVIRPDGTQAWVQVRNGEEITNGGINVIPR